MKDRADVKVLPPLILLSAFVAGAALRTLLPGLPFPTSLQLWLGSGLVACSIVLVVLASRELATARTAFDVRKSTTSIVTGGVFRITRNPVYLSMTLLYLGVALLLNSVVMAVVVVPLGSLLCVTAIKAEERYLESKFGDSYRSYRAVVRRWI